MEALLVIFYIVLFIFGILQIILFFKVWGMTNDIRTIKNKYLKTDFTHDPNNILTSISDDIPSFTINGNDIQFADGKSGRIRTYPRDKECSIYDDKGKEIIYNDKNAAINALYIFLSTGKISEKERFKP